MGFNISPDNELCKSSYKSIKNVQINTKVAMWQIPYNSKYSLFDTDNSHWLEAGNAYAENELEETEKFLNISLTKFKVFTQTAAYEDNSVEEFSTYPNGNQVNVIKSQNAVFVKIKDKSNQIVAEKIYSNNSNEGKKYIYKHLKKGDNTFTIVKIFSYDTTKNKQSDIVNYGYTSDITTLTNGCRLENEYYQLNGKQVEAKKNKDGSYTVNTENGEILKFSK